MEKRKSIIHAAAIAFILFVLLVICVGFMTGCGNRQVIDTVRSFEYGIIQLPNGEVVEGEVESWRDYEDGDQLQIKIDGKTYLVHSEDVALISE